MNSYTIDVKFTGSATEEELKDFLSFEIGASCSIDNDNPFINESAGITSINLY